MTHVTIVDYSDYFRIFPTPTKNCIAVGWGVTAESSSEASDTLMEVSVPLISRENCIKLPRPYNLVSPGAICAGYKDGGKDACTGDSGGPLLCQMQEGSPWVSHLKKKFQKFPMQK